MSHKRKKITLPGELIAYIAKYCSFREVLILHFLERRVDPKGYLKEKGHLTPENAIAQNSIYEVHYRMLQHNFSAFQIAIFVSRAIRLRRWKIVCCLVRTHKVKVWMWDVIKAIQLGASAKLVEEMLAPYSSALRDRYQPICLLEAGKYSNEKVFNYLMMSCSFQRRWRGKVRKTMAQIEQGKWGIMIA